MPTVVSVSHTGSENDVAYFTISQDDTSVDWECSLSADEHPRQGPSIANFAIRPSGGDDIVHRSHEGEGTTTDSGTIILDSGDYEIEVWHEGFGGRDIDASGSATYEEDEPEYHEGGSEAGFVVGVEAQGSKTGSGGIAALCEVFNDGQGVKQGAGGSQTHLAVSGEGRGQIVTPEAQGGSEAGVLIDFEAQGQKKARSPPAEAGVDLGSQGLGEKTGQGAGESKIETGTQGHYERESRGASESKVTVDTRGQGHKIIPGYAEGGSQAEVGVRTEAQGQKEGQGSSEAGQVLILEGQGEKKARDGTQAVVVLDGEAGGRPVTDEIEGGSMAGVLVETLGQGSVLKENGSETGLVVDTEGRYFVVCLGAGETQVKVEPVHKGQKSVKGANEALVLVNTVGRGNFFGREVNFARPRIVRRVPARRGPAKRGLVSRAMSRRWFKR